MVKPDVKHNYYADLDLPTNASIEDVRKAYRKLALQFHPDRNAGKEAECVPRFQAIQAANEVLCDPTTKARYDADRRKAGLYPSTTFKPNVPTPGNPYAASSAFPPPPRRTQPGQSTYQRSGADRFTNFPRGANTAPRKDPASERTEQFRAWQSMNTGTQRPAPPPRPAASPKPPTPTSSRPGMPRQDTKLPSEEQIRAGMRHGKAPTSSGETLNARQTAWQEYGKNGPTRSRPQRPAPATSKRPGGFDPNAPGSDERAAPPSSHYNRRNRSEDFTAGGFPPPPPGPPPASGPQSPVSPGTPRPYADPLRSFKQRNHDDDVPYMEGNRTSSPYSSVSGEKTQFSSDGLRRSASTRDTSKLHPESPASSTRARSTSPLGRQQKQTNGTQARPSPRQPFMPGVDSSSSSDDVGAAPRERKIAQPKSRRDRFPNSIPSPLPHSPVTELHSEIEQPSMQQRKSSTNMYARPSLPSTAHASTSSFSREDWFGKNFGHGRASVPRWGWPSSLLPSFSKRKPRQPLPEACSASNELLQEVEHDPSWRQSSTDQRQAYLYFRAQAIISRGIAMDPKAVTMADLFKLVELVQNGASTDVAFYDNLLSEILERFPSVGRKDAQEMPADNSSSAHRFSIPIHHDTFTPTSTKSRSEENINTNFSPEGWSGKFAGSTDYFASETIGRKRSPARRAGGPRGLYTPDSGSVSANESMPPPPPPDSTRPGRTDAPPFSPETTRPVPPSDHTFSEEEWKSKFQDASWTWPPPPSTAPPTETKAGLRSKVSSRKTGKLSSKSSHLSSASNASTHGTAGSRESPLIVDDDEAEPDAEPDAMDIDTPPPARPDVPDATDRSTPNQPTSSEKEARIYSVPVSEWRQQQEATREFPHAKRQAQASLKTNLDDLANVEPIARSADGGLKNLADLSSSLPFPSQPSVGTSAKESRALQIPHLPKVPAVPHKWTKASWPEYAQRFAAYLEAHHKFMRIMLAHFEAREKVAEVRMKDRGWVEAAGDVFEAYAKDVRQDEKVIEVFAMAGERHKDAVENFETCREQIRRIVAGGGLVD